MKLSRSSVLLILPTAIALSLFSSSCGRVSDESKTSYTSSQKPNIIFIMADDLGYGDLGSYGQTVIQTPHLDQMAIEGLRFTNCYAGSTVCAPSRSVLMTGLHTGHTTVRGNFGKFGVVGLAG
ncbi:MAG: arylsulfatase A-like enzyme, partial [Candidatus Pelagisphaera sp.]